jgi:tetratricopeptide repeat protein 30
MYDDLVKHHGGDEYRFYHAQCLYKAGQYSDALRACAQVEGAAFRERVTKLQMYIKFERKDVAGTRAEMQSFPADDPDTVVVEGCLAFREAAVEEGKLEVARAKFTDALNRLGFHAGVHYNIALTYYMEKSYAQALKHVGDIIERGMRDHPELCVGSNGEGFEVRSVGNSTVLRESALVEAFNLKAAIEFMMKRGEACVETLQDMPPRSEDELDPVTLHNLALMNIEAKPADGFRKLNFLLQNPPFPQETFGNLLLLYTKMEQFDLAADVLAENTHLSISNLKQDVYEFLEAALLQEISPEESFKRYDDIAARHIDTLRKLTKKINDYRIQGEKAGVKAALKEYDEALERYIPVLMGMAKIYWNLKHYAMVEKLFLQSSEFCSEHDAWKLNVAHTCFMQDNKYREAIEYYGPFVKKNASNLLGVPAMTLANLCVAYIMTSQNDLAEDVMRELEKEEEAVAEQDPDKPQYHLCIVNLVIGTLYCAKGNFEFGISRVIKSLEPYPRRLGTDTWFYAKRCFLALTEVLSKHMVMLKDQSRTDILTFLDQADFHGKKIKTKIAKTDRDIVTEYHTVSYEARSLKRIFLKLSS